MNGSISITELCQVSFVKLAIEIQSMSEPNRSPFKLETDLLSLRTLIAVVEEGGFSAAAGRVNRTQSAVSLQIAKLEERLNVKLLDRTSRSLSVTPAGEKFVNYAYRILEMADEAILAVTSPDEPTLLRVGFTEYLAPQHLHTLLARFRRAHPNCDLSLVLGIGPEMLDSLNQGKLDVVFAGPEATNGEVLWEEPLVWTGTMNQEQPDDPVELVTFPQPCSYRQLAFESLSKAGKQWKLSIEANSVQAIQSAIKAGLGLSVLPRSTIQEGMPILGDDALPSLPTTPVMSYMGADTANPYAQRFIDYLVASKGEGLAAVAA